MSWVLLCGTGDKHIVGILVDVLLNVPIVAILRAAIGFYKESQNPMWAQAAQHERKNQ